MPANDYLEKLRKRAKGSTGEGRKYLTGRKWELIGYSWHQNIVTDKWNVMRVFGDGSSDPAEIESYETKEEAKSQAEAFAKVRALPSFPPESIYTVFKPLRK